MRESDGDRRVVAVRALHEDRAIVIKARHGVILATGGHTSNVAFRRMFDARLTEEYQVVGEPWSRQSAAGEIYAMELGAALWGAGSQCQGGLEMSKTMQIGCRYGYARLKWDPRSPMFAAAGASGLSVVDWQDVILVDQTGRRFWDETDESRAFFDACLAPHGSAVANGGGPIWAVFDHAAVVREEWVPQPPHVDERGWFFRANSLEELAEQIENPYQREPMSSDALRATVERYNRFVDEGRDADYGKPSPHTGSTPRPTTPPGQHRRSTTPSRACGSIAMRASSTSAASRSRACMQPGRPRAGSLTTAFRAPSSSVGSPDATPPRRQARIPESAAVKSRRREAAPAGAR